MSELLVDARGLRCPWPVLRLARAMRDLGGRGAIRLLADDPAAQREIAALAQERGWECTLNEEPPAPKTWLIVAH